MTPKVRQIMYSVGVVVFAALALLSTFRVIDSNTAATVSAAITSVLGLFGVTVAGTAAYNVNKQQKSGAFDHYDPVEQVVNGINAAIAQAQDAATGLERVRTATTDALNAGAEVLTPLAEQIIKRQ